MCQDHQVYQNNAHQFLSQMTLQSPKIMTRVSKLVMEVIIRPKLILNSKTNYKILAAKYNSQNNK